jgi:hypothetical protein
MIRIGFLILSDGADLSGLSASLRASALPGDVVHVMEAAPYGAGGLACTQNWGPGVTLHTRRVSARAMANPAGLASLLLEEVQSEWALILRGDSCLVPQQIAMTRRLVSQKTADLVLSGPGPFSVQDALLNMAFYRNTKEQFEDWGAVSGLLQASAGGVEHLPESWREGRNLVTKCDISHCFWCSPWFGNQHAERPQRQATPDPQNLPRARDSLSPRRARTKDLSSPAQIGRAKILLAAVGPHAHRQPFAYASLRPLWEERITLTPDTETADIVCFAHPEDARIWPDLARLSTEKPVAILSEEPFWDSLFSPDPTAETVQLPSHEGEVALWQINHHKSALFDFAKIPYLLQTDPRIGPRLAARFRRNALLDAKDWEAAFRTRAEKVMFMAARRDEAFHDILGDGGIIGLSRWRSKLALACRGAVRLGNGWEGSADRRHLPDWHLDKLVRLDAQTRLLSAIENTHQPTYVSEKIFDAFACGALPLYVAGPGHGIYRLGLPDDSWINLWGLDLPSAVQTIQASVVDFAAYAEAQRRLAALFSDPAHWLAERARLKRALLTEMEALADKGAAFSARLPRIR